MFRDPSTLIFSLPGLLLAITAHELAHGFAADAMGDPTPRASGRLSLNPLVHLDFVGTLMLVMFRFGWAKPVPINPMYFRDRQRGMLLTAIAGPGANVVLATVATYLILQFPALRITVFGTMLIWLLQYNIWLAVFNMIPIPPLDGSHVASALIPYDSPLRRVLHTLNEYGWLILILLLVTGMISSILFPLSNALLSIIERFAGFLVI